MPDYQNGVIYVIYVSDLKYVGSTVNFESRKRQHKSALNNPNSRAGSFKLYKAIRENGGEWRMEIYKEFPCDSKQELLLEEERIRKELGAELNGICCGSGLTRDEYEKQYRQDNKEKTSEYQKQHYQDNKEKISERHKQHYQDNKEKISEHVKQYREQNKEKISERGKQYHQDNKEKISERQKQHYQDNKEKISEQQKQYREKNKEKISERNAQKIECPICGLVVSNQRMSRHQRTAKCKLIAEQRAEEVGSS